MDIEYLLLLQQFREATGNILTPFMENISLFIIGVVPMAVFCLIYWCWDKKVGTLFMFNFASANFVNGIVKLTACIYRPWIRDARVIPAGDAIVTATGYSFPSGHATNATAYYGSVALWQRKKHRLITAVMVFLLMLTLFSRNYLGVHTPQDVLVGFVLTAVFLLVNPKILAWIDAKPGRDRLALIDALAIGSMAFLYLNVKPYPLDYINGTMVVDPVKMMPDSYQGIGFWGGFWVGWFLERNFIRFEMYQNRKKQFFVAAFSLIPLYFIQSYGVVLLNVWLDAFSAKFLSAALLELYIFVVVPLLLKVICQAKKTCGRSGIAIAVLKRS